MDKRKVTKKSKTSKKVPALQDKFVPRYSTQVIARKNPNNTFSILRLDGPDFFYALDGMAADIWSRINGAKTLAQIKEEIRRQYKPPEARYEKDFKKLFQNLLNENLIE